MSYKLIIFDFDGTLSDTLPHILSCGQKVINHFKLRQPTMEEINAMNGGVFADVMLALGAKEEQLDDMKKFYKKVFLDDLSDIKLYDGVYDTLSNLKELGFKLAVATNRGRNILIPLLEHLKILNFFDAVVAESDVKNKKPNPEMVDLVLDKLKINKIETLIVGDSKYDVLLGKNSGVKTCIISYQGNKFSGDIIPDYNVFKFNDITNFVLDDKKPYKINKI